MITLDRVLVRQARAVFRKLLGRQAHALSVPLKITAGTGGLALEAVSHQGAARFQQPGSFPASETLQVPFNFLDDCQANRPGEVTLQRERPGTITAQWTDGRVPQIVQYGEAELSKVHEFPELPPAWSSNPPELLAALSAAMETTDPHSTRYTLACILLSGPNGRVAATDGRHIYLHDGFAFGWEDEVLLPANPVIGCRELARDQSVDMGVTKHFLALRTGGWTISLPRQLEGHFPDVDSAIPGPDQITATAYLAREDIEFLRQSLGKLRCEEGLDVPITFDLNGSVVVRCQPFGQPKPLELVLTNSTRDGAEVSFNANRTQLLRALELGLDKLHFATEETPVLWQADNCRYAWAPFSKEEVIPTCKDVIRLASPARGASSVPATVDSRRRPQRVAPANGDHCPTAAQPTVAQPRTVAPMTRKRRATNGKPSGGVDGLIQQAEAVHVSLRQTLLQNRELLKALKQHRRQTRLVRSTLSSLKQLQGIGA